MKYAEIKNGKVINIVEAEPDVAAERGWVECKVGGIGWDYDGSTFVDNRPKPTPAPAPTKEELIAQLQTMQELQTQLQTQIQALE